MLMLWIDEDMIIFLEEYKGVIIRLIYIMISRVLDQVPYLALYMRTVGYLCHPILLHQIFDLG